MRHTLWTKPLTPRSGIPKDLEVRMSPEMVEELKRSMRSYDPTEIRGRTAPFRARKRLLD